MKTDDCPGLISLPGTINQKSMVVTKTTAKQMQSITVSIGKDKQIAFVSPAGKSIVSVRMKLNY